MGRKGKKKVSPVERSDPFVKDPEAYRERCRQYEHRSSLACFGLDFIIDRLGEVHCIEINGQNSGTGGFEEAYGEDFARRGIFHYLASFGLPVTLYTHELDLEEEGWAAEELGVVLKDIDKVIMQCAKKALCWNEKISDQEYHRRRVQLTKREELQFNLKYSALFSAMTKTRLSSSSPEQGGMYSFEEAECIVWNNTGHTFNFDPQRFFVINTHAMEWVTEYKRVAAKLMHPTMKNTAWCNLSHFLTLPGAFRKQFPRYVQKLPGEYLVLKPDDGACGRGVVILPKKALLNASGELRRDLPKIFENPGQYFKDERLVQAFAELTSFHASFTYPTTIIEPFIESKAYLSPETGKMHRGCIRYMLVAQSNQGKISLQHFGGCVRLAPEPISDSPSLHAQVANISLGGHGAPLSPTDTQRLERWIDRFFPQFYRRLLRLDGEPTINFHNALFVDHFESVYQQPWKWNPESI